MEFRSSTEELRWDPEINKVVMFSEFAAFYGGELTEEEKLELWHACQIILQAALEMWRLK